MSEQPIRRTDNLFSEFDDFNGQNQLDKTRSRKRSRSNRFDLRSSISPKQTQPSRKINDTGKTLRVTKINTRPVPDLRQVLTQTREEEADQEIKISGHLQVIHQLIQKVNLDKPAKEALRELVKSNSLKTETPETTLYLQLLSRFMGNHDASEKLNREDYLSRLMQLNCIYQKISRDDNLDKGHQKVMTRGFNNIPTVINVEPNKIPNLSSKEQRDIKERSVLLHVRISDQFDHGPVLQHELDGTEYYVNLVVPTGYFDKPVHMDSLAVETYQNMHDVNRYLDTFIGLADPLGFSQWWNKFRQMIHLLPDSVMTPRQKLYSTYQLLNDEVIQTVGRDDKSLFPEDYYPHLLKKLATYYGEDETPRDQLIKQAVNRHCLENGTKASPIIYRQDNTCQFHLQPQQHVSHDCLLPYHTRLTRITRKMRCMKCLQPGHTINRCSSSIECGYCRSGEHHTSLCSAMIAQQHVRFPNQNYQVPTKDCSSPPRKSSGPTDDNMGEDLLSDDCHDIDEQND